MALDFSATFNGLSFGAGTTIQIVDVSGFDDLPGLRTTDQPRPRDTGEFGGNDLSGGRDVTMTLLILDSGVGDFYTTVEAFKAATVPQGTNLTLPLVVQFPGGRQRQLNCRPRQRSLPTDVDYVTRYGKAAVQFHAVDPRWYDVNQSSGSMTPPSATTGLVFNAAFDLSFGGGTTGGQLTCVNNGNFETRPVITVTGPCTNVTLTNNTTGLTVGANITLAAGDSLVFDFGARTIVLNGTTSRYNAIAPASVWWNLAPGSNDIRFLSSSTTGTAQVVWRSAWL